MSDIFNEYAKIAIAKNLIKEAEEGTETNPRYDSLDLDAIQMLYGIKPNGEEKHIMEQAHPDPVVIAPAYDAVNGLVENNLERQDVMHYIATKPNHGKHIQERYVKARKELLNEVLKVAFVLDRDNEEELMNFADNCAEQLTKTSAIIAAIPWLTWTLLAKLTAGTVASVGLVNNFSGMLSEGFATDADRAIEEVNDVINENDLPGYEKDLQDLVNLITEVKQLHAELATLNVSGDNEQDIQNQLKEGETLLINFIKKARLLSREAANISGIIAASESTDRPWYSGFGLKKIVETIWTTDKQDAKTALDTLRGSLSESITNMQRFYQAVKSKAQNMKDNIDDVLIEENESPEELPEDLSVQTPNV